MITPLHLSILMHCYCSAGGVPHHNTSDVAKRYRLDLIEMGLVVGWEITEFGQAYVHTILSSPLPEVCFVNPVTKEIIMKSDTHTNQRTLRRASQPDGQDGADVRTD